MYITIESPARLHFGLWEICPTEPGVYGGVGAALDRPVLSLQVSECLLESDSPNNASSSHRSLEAYVEFSKEIDETLRLRIKSTVENYFQTESNEAIEFWRQLFRSKKLVFESREPVLYHQGLGSGTQIACSVVTLMEAWKQCSSFADRLDFDQTTANRIWRKADSNRPDQSIDECSIRQDLVSPTLVSELSNASGRGKRSHVGLAAHLQGGFIIDPGHFNSEQPVDLDADQQQLRRFPMPDHWNVILARPKSIALVSGEVESGYFSRCAVPNTQRLLMKQLVEKEMLPALATLNLPSFGEALFEYGRLAGEIFSPVQGGAYRDEVTSQLVSRFRESNVAAVGQSSWGPSVFGIVDSQEVLAEVLQSLKDEYKGDIELEVTRFSNQGAQVAVHR